MSDSQKSTIIINGKKYDARTGQMLHDPVAPKPKPVHDVIRHPSQSKQVHRTIEKSKTLMRHAVKKPSKHSVPKPSATSVMRDVIGPVTTVSQPTTLSHTSDTERERRAAKVKRSSLVSKFGDIIAQPSHKYGAEIEKRVVPLAVTPAPKHHEPSKSQTAESMIAAGLRNAQSHLEKPHKAPKKHRTRARKAGRVASIGAGALATLLLVGFIAYQNVPNISMRYAATKAGVRAQLPGYQPAGFALNKKIQYNPGQITLQFNSNSDDRSFTITQRASSWNSDTLMSNYVASTADSVQRLEDKGRTIYMYNGSNATWVNGGIWYEINGNSQLTSDQLIRIATSM